MQPCNRIYYSKVYWRLNMFRASYRSSSGVLNCICNLWFTYTCGDRPLSRLSGKWIHFPLRLDKGRSPHAYANQRLQIQLELLMTSGMPLETCSAFNERRINKFYYKVASCWLFLLSHSVNIYSNWLQEQFCNLSLYALYILSVR